MVHVAFNSPATWMTPEQFGWSGCREQISGSSNTSYVRKLRKCFKKQLVFSYRTIYLIASTMFLQSCTPTVVRHSRLLNWRNLAASPPAPFSRRASRCAVRRWAAPTTPDRTQSRRRSSARGCRAQRSTGSAGRTANWARRASRCRRRRQQSARCCCESVAQNKQIVGASQCCQWKCHHHSLKKKKNRRNSMLAHLMYNALQPTGCVVYKVCHYNTGNEMCRERRGRINVQQQTTAICEKCKTKKKSVLLYMMLLYARNPPTQRNFEQNPLDAGTTPNWWFCESTCHHHRQHQRHDC